MKYMGNKQKIADEILTVIFNDSKKTDTFVDLFCGSCSIIERVPDSYIKIANDKNKFLIEMFKSLINGNDYPKIITKNDYDARRDLYNLSKRYLVLTDKNYAEIGWYGWMASFNGRFFSGGYSGHNVFQKNGKTRDYIKEQINNTLKTIPKLKNVNFVSEEYDKVDIPQGSIVYADIPYYGTKKWKDLEHFRKVQRNWVGASIAASIILNFSLTFIVMLFGMSLAANPAFKVRKKAQAKQAKKLEKSSEYPTISVSKDINYSFSTIKPETLDYLKSRSEIKDYFDGKKLVIYSPN